MKYLTLSFLILFSIGCKKEGTTSSKAYLKNSTTHSIECRPYFAGTAPSANIFKVQPSETIEIGNGNFRGIVGQIGFNPKYFYGADSIVVIYDNIYSIAHYGKTPPILNPKHYLYSSLRNIANYLSYQYTYEDKTKYSRLADYNFVFTEQDYLDAK